MRVNFSSVLLRGSVIAGILLLTGQGQPDIANAGGRGLSQSPSFMANVPKVPVSTNEAKVKQNLSYGNIPLYFIPNKGQVNEAARFYARASRYTLWLTAEGLVFDRSVSREKPADRTARPWKREETLRPATGPAKDLRGENRREVHRLVFKGANPEPEIEGEGGTGHTANYFIGSDPSKWRTNITTSRAAVYKELYPKTDLKVYGVEKQIEYDWLVKPGGDPEAIDFAYQDVLGTKIDASGDLIIRTELGEFRHRKPDAYQEGPDGTRESIDAHFRQIGPARYGFQVGRYDRTRPLLIDPVVLIYSTYLGGSIGDEGHGIAVDNYGCAYICGETFSPDFPTRNPFQGSNHLTTAVFVTKLTASGDSLVYSTYLGGTAMNVGYAIAVDSSGCAHITGYTISTDFPIQSPYQADCRGWSDAFVTKLAASGDELVYSTHLGGSSGEWGLAIALDSSGCAYVTGFTQSEDFPTRNPFQTSHIHSTDVFVTKLSAAGDDLEYSTYLSGDSEDWGRGISVDSAGCAYVTGSTRSSDFPMRRAFQWNHQGGWWTDAFVTILTAEGNDLVFSTYLGGSDGDVGYGIFVDRFFNVYVTGITDSHDFPLRNPFQPNTDGSAEAFVTKFSALGPNIIYSTYLGGYGYDRGWGITADASGCAYIVGSTTSSNFPTRNPFKAENEDDETDAFVAKFTDSGDDLKFSTYLGGSGQYMWDEGYGIAVDSSGCAYVTGRTQSVDFPIQSPFQAQLHGYRDAFVAKLILGFAVTASVSGVGGSVSPATQTVIPGESATVNIYPDSGYGIASITDNSNSVSIANPYVINNVREDHDVVVTFARVYTVMASVSGVGGSVNPPTQTVMAGETATIDIYPDLGYHIGSVRDNGASAPIASPYIITNVQEDHAVVVTFANAPPTIRIVNPTNGAKVYGAITVKAEASDDLRVLKVAFLIDDQLIGEDAFAESTNVYAQAWDTRGYSAGIHRVKAVAFDEAGLTAEDAINVIVENVALTLQGQRLTESAWILKKQFIRLTISIQNLGQVSVAKYVIYRRNGAGDFKAIKEIPGSEVTGPTYVWVDKAINKNQTYTYRVLALSSNGVALGVSNDITL